MHLLEACTEAGQGRAKLFLECRQHRCIPAWSIPTSVPSMSYHEQHAYHASSKQTLLLHVCEITVIYRLSFSPFTLEGFFFFHLEAGQKPSRHSGIKERRVLSEHACLAACQTGEQAVGPAGGHSYSVVLLISLISPSSSLPRMGLLKTWRFLTRVGVRCWPVHLSSSPLPLIDLLKHRLFLTRAGIDVEKWTLIRYWSECKMVPLLWRCCLTINVLIVDLPQDQSFSLWICYNHSIEVLFLTVKGQEPGRGKHGR